MLEYIEALKNQETKKKDPPKRKEIPINKTTKFSPDNLINAEDSYAFFYFPTINKLIGDFGAYHVDLAYELPDKISYDLIPDKLKKDLRKRLKISEKDIEKKWSDRNDEGRSDFKGLKYI